MVPLEVAAFARHACAERRGSQRASGARPRAL